MNSVCQCLGRKANMSIQLTSKLVHSSGVGSESSVPGSGLFQAFQVVSAHHLNAFSAELRALLHQIGASHVQGFHGNINTQEMDIGGPIPAGEKWSHGYNACSADAEAHELSPNSWVTVAVVWNE